MLFLTGICYPQRLCEFCDPRYADIDLGDFIPGRIIDNAGFRKSEDRLEFSYGSFSRRAEDAVGSDFPDCGICIGNNGELLLHLSYLVAGGTDRQIISRPGGRNAGDRFGGIDIQIVAVVVAQDLDR